MNAQHYVEALRELKLDHRNFRFAYNSAYAQSALAPPEQLVAIVGPTRVGKTTLSKRLAHELVGDRSDIPNGCIPLVRIEAATTNQAKFSTKHFTLRTLAELSDPITLSAGLNFRHRESETHLRLQLERCIEYRKTKFLIIDEAHHLLRIKGQRHAGEVLDTFKCLGNSTRVVTILIGGYELLKVCFASAHLNGRLTVINFPPYTTDKDSLVEFDRILLTLDGMLPFVSGQSLLRFRDFIYAGSLGCLGLLVGWSISALAEMQARDDNGLRIRHFEVTRSAEQIHPISEEIALGKHLLPVNSLCARSSRSQSEPAIQVNRQRKSRPFIRNPKRDPGPHKIVKTKP